MRYEQYSADTRKVITALAAERGTTPQAVCRRFDELFAGNRNADGKPDPMFGIGRKA